MGDKGWGPLWAGGGEQTGKLDGGGEAGGQPPLAPGCHSPEIRLLIMIVIIDTTYTVFTAGKVSSSMLLSVNKPCDAK